ncbi:MAG: hypothetical protein KF866_02320 [Phycisphaeraceae bacterium]|nr:hypothetical protein [Phycisphaeraceae bacterium]
MQSRIACGIAAGVVSLGAFAAMGQAEGAPPPAEPAATATPSAAEVFRRHAEALGGVEAFKKRKNSVSEGSVATDDGSYFGLLTIWNVAPNKTSVLVEVPGTISEHLFFNGEYGWALYPEDRARVLRGGELLDLAQSADSNAPVELERVYTNAKVVGAATFKGARCWQVEGESLYRKREILYFDTATGLMRGMRTQVTTVQGVRQSTVTMEEYRDYDGIKVPVRIRQEIEGSPAVTIRLTKYRANVPESELPDFELPEWFRQALERAAEAEREQGGGQPQRADRP